MTTGPSGYAAVLAEMATLHALTVAGRRTPALDEDLAASVRTAVGWTVAREEVLATPPTTDHWHVVARSDTEEHRITVRRTWLLGRRSGRWGLLLDFAAFGQSLADEPAVGSVLYADLHHFPARVPIRALLGVEHEPAEEDETGPPASTVAGTLADAGWAIAREPWLERWPGVVLATPAPRHPQHGMGARRRHRRAAHRRDAGPADPARRLRREAGRRGRRASGRRFRPPGGPCPRPDGGAPMTAVRARGGRVWTELVATAMLGTDRRSLPSVPVGTVEDFGTGPGPRRRPARPSRRRRRSASCRRRARAGRAPAAPSARPIPDHPAPRPRGAAAGPPAGRSPGRPPPRVVAGAAGRRAGRTARAPRRAHGADERRSEGAPGGSGGGRPAGGVVVRGRARAGVGAGGRSRRGVGTGRRRGADRRPPPPARHRPCRGPCAAGRRAGRGAGGDARRVLRRTGRRARPRRRGGPRARPGRPRRLGARGGGGPPRRASRLGLVGPHGSAGRADGAGGRTAGT